MLKEILKIEGIKKLEINQLKKMFGGNSPLTGPDGPSNGPGGTGTGCVCLDPTVPPPDFIAIPVPCDSVCSDGSLPGYDPFSA
ncbi:hypothetical protein [Spongiimicrobium salis]|uniref:hypothetical protein n=1 Tax=Spongiimicrobium salis TaxID=1667022 RepID=UPI00374D31A9